MQVRTIDEKIPESNSPQAAGPEVKAVFYTGPGQSEVFAFLGIPEGTPPKDGWPGIVLVHGGGGHAFPEWARLWAQRGYVAIAMDHSTATAPGWAGFRDKSKPKNPRPDGVFDADKADIDTRDTWVWSATQSVVRAGDALRSLDIVDPDHIAITGISWGGYLTLIACSIDDRFAAAMPVYGSGFLEISSIWSADQINIHPPEIREKILSRWDPGRFVHAARTPILMLNGRLDRFYHLPAHSATFRAWGGTPRSLSYLNIGHGHGGPGEAPQELHATANAFCKNGFMIPMLVAEKKDGPRIQARFDHTERVTEARLIWTDSGPDVPWNKKRWTEIPAEWNPATGTAAAEIPEKALWAYLSIHTSPYPDTGWTMEKGAVLPQAPQALIFSAPLHQR